MKIKKYQKGKIIKGVTKGIKALTSAEKAGVPKDLRGKVDVTKYLQSQGFALPRKHLQGDEAVKMFKEYGTQSPKIENSPLMKQLHIYVPEIRDRYGLIGNANITDDEIAGSLYKKVLELGGDTAAVNAFGEPLVLFRGDTKRYLTLKPRMSPEELATKRGTMDNSLGTLFLDFPNHYQGVDRYLGTIRNFNGDWEYLNSGTGSKVIGGSRDFDPTSGFPKGTYKLYSGLFGKWQMPISVWKLPGSQMESGINDLNGFVVRTKSVRDATPEISVLNDDWLAKGAVGSTPHMRTILIEDENGFPLFKHPDGSVTEALAGMENRPGMAEHYRFVLDDAKSKDQGLLWSRSGAPLRDEHTDYNYYALPNFNIRGAKHILPFDFRIPTQWNSRIIYRKQGGILKAQGGLTRLTKVARKAARTLNKNVNSTRTKRYFGTNVEKLTQQRAFDIAYRDALINDNLKYGRNSGMLIHGDPSATGVTKPLGHIAGYNQELIDFPHFNEGRFVPSSTNDIFKEKGRKRIFWGKDVPFFESFGDRFNEFWESKNDKGLKLWTLDPKWIKEHPADFRTEVPYRYIVVERSKVPSAEDTNVRPFMSGNEVVTESIPIEDIDFGFEYNPLIKTFGRVKYINTK